MSVGLGAGAGTGSVSSVALVSLVGRWTRIEPADAGAGAGYAYEVTWTFNADGSARRTTRALAPSGAAVSSFDEPAAWAADGATLVVTFPQQPARTTRTIRYTIDAGASRTLLYLDGVPFTRVG